VSTLRRVHAATASAWASVRPRTRRGTALAVIAIVGAAAALSVALFVGAAMAWSPYLTFDLDRASNPRAQAAYPLTLAGSATCTGCHASEAAAVAANPHDGVACESCHGTATVHVDASPVPEAPAVAGLRVPENADCARCHAAADGRPATLAVVNPWQHYEPVCLECHDPHTSVAVRPPAVRHPLDDLPPCITCHGPDGFMARTARHPAATTDDAGCLACHGPNRGPARDDDR
jgi:cytochrome c554/c'-like protein